MTADKKTGDGLAGKFLLAMPGMGDPRFHRAVILVCAHDTNGAMGLVINHVLPGVDLPSLLGQLNIDLVAGDLAEVPVLSGGPVENARGFIVHSAEFHQRDTVRVTDTLSVTGTVDALRAAAQGSGPVQMIFVLGYAGWSAGQLDQELQENTWLVLDSADDIIFDVPPDEKWDVAIRRMGVDPTMLSRVPGRA